MKIKILLLVLGLLLASAVGAFGYKTFTEKFEITPKEKVLGEQEIELTPEPTALPTPTPTSTPTPKPTFKPAPTNIPMPTSIPKPQKVPVFLPHSGQTVQCNPEGVDAVKNASQAILDAKAEGDRCKQNAVDYALNCTNTCNSRYHTYDALTACYNECKTNYSYYPNCSTGVSQSYYDSLNSLLGTYCPS